MVRRWDYGDAGDRIPVRFGEAWRCGPHMLGRRFVGTKLNPRRMAVTLDKLQKAGAGSPERVE